MLKAFSSKNKQVFVELFKTSFIIFMAKYGGGQIFLLVTIEEIE
jgi:hypothetical protein